MKRAHSQVCREMAEALEQLNADPYERFVTRTMLQRWLLLLAPPKKKRPRPSAGVTKRRVTMRECDAMFRDLIRARDGCCRKCGGSSHLQVAHIFSRRFLRIRHHKTNALLLCAKDHLWAHHNPIEAGRFFQEQIGTDSYLMLSGLKTAIGRNPDLSLVKRKLEQELRDVAPTREGGR